jgi:hypothetical protein
LLLGNCLCLIGKVVVCACVCVFLDGATSNTFHQISTSTGENNGLIDWGVFMRSLVRGHLWRVGHLRQASGHADALERELQGQRLKRHEGSVSLSSIVLLNGAQSPSYCVANGNVWISIPDFALPLPQPQLQGSPYFSQQYNGALQKKLSRCLPRQLLDQLQQDLTAAAAAAAAATAAATTTSTATTAAATTTSTLTEASHHSTYLMFDWSAFDTGPRVCLRATEFGAQQLYLSEDSEYAINGHRMLRTDVLPQTLSSDAPSDVVAGLDSVPKIRHLRELIHHQNKNKNLEKRMTRKSKSNVERSDAILQEENGSGSGIVAATITHTTTSTVTTSTTISIYKTDGYNSPVNLVDGGTTALHTAQAVQPPPSQKLQQPAFSETDVPAPEVQTHAAVNADTQKINIADDVTPTESSWSALLAKLFAYHNACESVGNTAARSTGTRQKGDHGTKYKSFSQQENKILLRNRNLVLYHVDNPRDSLNSHTVLANNVKIFVASVLSHAASATCRPPTTFSPHNASSTKGRRQSPVSESPASVPATAGDAGAFYVFSVTGTAESNPLAQYLPDYLPNVHIVYWPEPHSGAQRKLHPGGSSSSPALVSTAAALKVHMRTLKKLLEAATSNTDSATRSSSASSPGAAAGAAAGTAVGRFNLSEAFSAVVCLSSGVRGPLAFADNGAWLREYRNLLDFNEVGLVGATTVSDTSAVVALHFFVLRTAKVVPAVVRAYEKYVKTVSTGLWPSNLLEYFCQSPNQMQEQEQDQMTSTTSPGAMMTAVLTAGYKVASMLHYKRLQLQFLDTDSIYSGNKGTFWSSSSSSSSDVEGTSKLAVPVYSHSLSTSSLSKAANKWTQHDVFSKLAVKRWYLQHLDLVLPQPARHTENDQSNDRNVGSGDRITTEETEASGVSVSLDEPGPTTEGGFGESTESLDSEPMNWCHLDASEVMFIRWGGEPLAGERVSVSGRGKDRTLEDTSTHTPGTQAYFSAKSRTSYGEELVDASGYFCGANVATGLYSTLSK